MTPSRNRPFPPLFPKSFRVPGVLATAAAAILLGGAPVAVAADMNKVIPVSYTHLTLPTICSV